MASGPSDSFFDEYQAISNKLKKRFLRKPNVAEAGQEFASLAARLARAEQPEYSALCQLARSHCEQTLGSGPGESAALLAAARQFLQAHREHSGIGAVTAGEQLQNAISLYNSAIQRQLAGRQSQLAAGTCLQLAHALYDLGRPTEAQLYFRDAADLQPAPGSLSSWQLAAQCQLELVDLQGALSTLDAMQTCIEEYGGRPIQGVYITYLRWCEVTSLLLLLAMSLPSSQLKPAHLKTLEKYSQLEERHRGGHISEHLYLLLQSLVLAAQRVDLRALYCLEGDLRSQLDQSQRDLLSRLVQHLELRAPPSGPISHPHTEQI